MMRMTKTIKRNRPGARSAFTLIELMITTVIMAIVGLAIGVVIVDGQTGWNAMYGRINSDIAADGYVAQKKFDSVMRRAIQGRSVVAGDGSWVEVSSYATPASTTADRYWRFYVSGDELIAECGELEPRSTLSSETVCENVSECSFAQSGQAIQMTLVLDNGTQTNTIVSSAIAHNQ